MARRRCEATIHSAKEISFTILSMTISLAAVFIPLVFMSGLVGRIFREFAITIVVAIIASGLVSLTLTPLMCARLLKDRGEGSKRTWMERKVGAMEKRVLDRYGRSLTLVSRSSLGLGADLGGLHRRTPYTFSSSCRKHFCLPATAVW